MRVLILGAGGVGGFVGSRLISAGADVLFLARGARLASLRDKGLTIDSSLGRFSAPVQSTDAVPAAFVPDLVVIACKAPGLDAALDAIAPAVGNGTAILPFLNGVAHLEAIGRRFPQSPLLGGIAHGALTVREDGTVVHLTPFFSAIIGPVSTSGTDIAKAATELLARAGVDIRLSPDIMRDMWGKFTFIATLAGATCLMRASVGTILANDGGEGMILGLLAECLSVALAEGIGEDRAIMAAYRRVLIERGSPLTSSMLRDVREGKATECDHILGDMQRRAQRHALPTPILDMAHAHLRCYETERAMLHTPSQGL